VFSYRAANEFNRLRNLFLIAPNFREVNRNSGHGAFSEGLSAYQRYLECLGKSKIEVVKEGAEAVYYINGKKLIVRSAAKHPELLDGWTDADIPALIEFKKDLSHDQPARSAANIIIRCLKNGVQSNWIPSDINGALPNPPNNNKTQREHTISDEIRTVDFDHSELCSDCNPVTCEINGEDIPVGTWRDLLLTLVERFITIDNNFLSALTKKPLFHGSQRPFLLDEKPNGAARQISTGHWVYMNLSIANLVDLIGRLCRFCGVNSQSAKITYIPKSNNSFSRTERTETPDSRGSSGFAQQDIRVAFREWLTQRNPLWGIDTLNMLCSDALYLYNNDGGITLEEALTDADGLEKAYNALEQHFAVYPRQTGTAATVAKGYTDTLRLFKEFLSDRSPELLSGNGTPALIVPQAVLDVLFAEYAKGFRFDMTAIRLLSSKSGIEVDNTLQSALKRQMFSRGDNIYFLLNLIANEDTCKEIINIANALLDEYGCFEISELYALYEDKLNRKYISNADDFEKFYEFINTRTVRCVAAPYIGNRIARFSNGSVWNTFNEIAAKIVAVTHDVYGGTVSEDDLHSRFCAFSTDLLAKIIKNAAEELVRTEINGIVVYQTLDALGLTDDFSDTLHNTLDRLDDLGIAPSVEALHTAISLAIDVNFNTEFNIPDKATYQRLIAAYYKAEPPREWKGGVFSEVPT